VSVLVWVSDWQIQCCGEDFSVGGEVTWTILPRAQWAGGMEPVLGVELDAAVTGSYETHGDDPLPELGGTVRRIRTVSCRYDASPPPHDPREQRPVPGTSVLEDVPVAEKRFDTDIYGLRFCGWLVDVEVPA
jgi:hypothetical protein